MLTRYSKQHSDTKKQLIQEFIFLNKQFLKYLLCVLCPPQKKEISYASRKKCKNVRLQPFEMNFRQIIFLHFIAFRGTVSQTSFIPKLPNIDQNNDFINVSDLEKNTMKLRKLQIDLMRHLCRKTKTLIRKFVENNKRYNAQW